MKFLGTIRSLVTSGWVLMISLYLAEMPLGQVTGAFVIFSDADDAGDRTLGWGGWPAYVGSSACGRVITESCTTVSRRSDTSSFTEAESLPPAPSRRPECAGQKVSRRDSGTSHAAGRPRAQ